ncbi:MAG TPA: hypothetical protein PKA94_13850, partial [Ferruginibacter sp.]|nr:hypothetical protein [Ferruginibacter sp.]
MIRTTVCFIQISNGLKPGLKTFFIPGLKARAIQKARAFRRHKSYLKARAIQKARAFRRHKSYLKARAIQKARTIQKAQELFEGQGYSKN